MKEALRHLDLAIEALRPHHHTHPFLKVMFVQLEFARRVLMDLAK